MSSPALLWELVKKNNAFISKNINRTIWSKEPCNLYVYNHILHASDGSVEASLAGLGRRTDR